MENRLDDKKKLDVLKNDKTLHEVKLDPEVMNKLDANRVQNGLHLSHGNGIMESQGSPQLVARVYSRKRGRDAIPDAVAKKSKQKSDEKVNQILGKTAEVILVLAGLSQMRGGKPPTELELQLANDAESSLLSLVSRVSPSSLATKHSLDNIVSSMGFRRTVDGNIEPAPRPQEAVKPKEDSDSDDESSDDEANQNHSAWDPFHAALLTSPSALSLDEDTDADLKQCDDYDEIQDEQSQLIRHRQLVRLVQQLKAENYVPQQLGEVNNSYMVTLVPCDVCQCIVRDTVSVVVCDGCEKVFHCKCLPFWDYPRGDWSCPKCNGVKPRYGPVKKGSGTPNKMPIRKPENKQTPSTSALTPQANTALSSNGPVEAAKQQPPLPPPPKAQVPPSQEIIEAVEKLKAQAEEAAAASTQNENTAAAAGQNENAAGQVCLHVDWVGAPAKVVDKRVYYSSCCVGGWTYKLQDCALFRPESPEIPPYIARLQTLWEDLETGLKWVRVNWCYYPNDMPAIAGRPDEAETDEVYESNHCDNNLVGSIQGPCQVLVPQKFAEENARREKLFPAGVSEELPPIFLCRWTYNAQKGVFQKVKDGS